MIERPHQLSVADATLLRRVLTFYEEQLVGCHRTLEEPPITVAVVQTLESLRRLYLRLSNWVEAVDVALDDQRTDREDRDDPPF